jgi:spore coat polysaccharide biosynthesis protein SpsF (cytidylyltransferase family)
MNIKNSENPLIIIQARMGSSRLPGKSMMLVNNIPLLGFLIENIFSVFKNSKIVIATSELKENDIIREYGKVHNIDVISGDEFNVASRFVLALELFKEYQYFIRMCGDSPFFDIELLKKGKALLEQNNKYDFITSKFEEGFPMGSNLEIIKRDIFLRDYSCFKLPSHFEHVTQFFYEKFENYKAFIIKCNHSNSDLVKYKLSVDTLSDFEKAVYMLNRMDYKPWEFTLEDKFKLIDEYNNLIK